MTSYLGLTVVSELFQKGEVGPTRLAYCRHAAWHCGCPALIGFSFPCYMWSGDTPSSTVVRWLFQVGGVGATILVGCGNTAWHWRCQAQFVA